jgi:Na+-transporting methylmalonyl-CoA/oxaloacetate decarboxylase gamma subunit
MFKQIFLATFVLFVVTGLLQAQPSATGKSDSEKKISVTTNSADTSKKVVEKSLIHFNLANIWEVDCNGRGNSIVVTLIGMGVVYLALFLLYVSFEGSSRVIRKIVAAKHAKDHPNVAPKQAEEEMSAEVNAAIAMALYSYFSANHDQENTVLTIQRVSRMYSPWSSKIYNLRHHPKNW